MQHSCFYVYAFSDRNLGAADEGVYHKLFEYRLCNRCEDQGLSSGRILFSYIGRNAMLPIVTEFAMRLGFIVGGALIVEQLFVYQGIGLELLNATNGRDYPLMQGVFLIMTISIVVCNFLAEVFYVVLDPRIKVEGT